MKKNFRQAYIDRVENIPLYESDYVYYLYERFLYEYLPNMIDKNIQAKESEVAIASRDIEKYIMDMIRNDVMRAVKDGTLKIDNSKNICRLSSDIDEDKEGKNKLSSEESTIVCNYAEKFVCYLHLVMEYIFKLPFVEAENGHVNFNLMEAFDYYDVIEQLDYSVSPKTQERKEFEAYTRDVFYERIVNGLIPALIEKLKSENVTKGLLSYSIDKGVANFGDVEFKFIDLYELGRCINRMPLKDLTDYEARSKDVKIQNIYKFEFNVQDLEEFYKKEQLKAKTREIFRETVVFGYLPHLIKHSEGASTDEIIDFEYSINSDGSIQFYKKTLQGVDLEEFYSCVIRMPYQSATPYSEFRRTYTFKFVLKDLIDYSNRVNPECEIHIPEKSR